MYDVFSFYICSSVYWKSHFEINQANINGYNSKFNLLCRIAIALDDDCANLDRPCFSGKIRSLNTI